MFVSKFNIPNLSLHPSPYLSIVKRRRQAASFRGPAPVTALYWVFRKDDITAQLSDWFQRKWRGNWAPSPFSCAVLKFQIPTPSGRSPNRSKIGRVRDFSLHPLFELTRVDKISFYGNDARRRATSQCIKSFTVNGSHRTWFLKGDKIYL